LAERITLNDIINRRARARDFRAKRSTGFNFFTDDTNENAYGSNTSFIQGYNTSAGNFDVDGLGDGSSNSAVTSALQVLTTSFSEARLKVCYQNSDGSKEEVTNHPFTTLMRRPNPYMSGDIVQSYIIKAMHVTGDAYLLKQRNEVGQLVALYPLMPTMITPKGTEEELITHYKYSTQDKTYNIEKGEIVHFKLGLNQSDHKQGFSPLKTVLREIFGDESAGQLSTALLSNLGVPSVMISPKDEFGVSEDEAEQISKTFQRKVGGKNKGKPLIMSGAMNVEKLAFSPKDLDIGLLRRVPEERISAVLGVPAILCGLGAGLDRATYSNASELREFFTENKLIPMWKMVAEELTQQILLRDYEEDQYYYSEYDFSNVRALQTDLSEIYSRLNVGVQGGWITLKEAREEVGLLTDETQDVFIRPNSTQAVPNGESWESELETPLPPTTTPEEIISEDVETASYGNKVIKKIEDQFCVIAEDSGKNMGCYPTRELAQRRLEQISSYSDNPKK
jgi:HK97 family phage portal protein